jgi:hypothetical protein
MRRRVGPLLLLALPIGACGDAAPASDAFELSDSAGIQIAFARIDTLGPVCPTTETLRIGSVEGDPATALQLVLDAERLPDGRIAVINSGTSQVKVFSAEGELLTEFGGRGGGPGEFTAQIWYVVPRGDTLAIAHRAPWSFSFFHGDGRFIRRIQLTPALVERPDVAFPLPTGLGFIVEDPARPVLEREMVMVDEVEAIRRYGEDGVLVDTVGSFWSGQIGLLDAELRYVGAPIFGPRAAIAHLRGDEIVYASGRFSQLEIVGLDGSLRRIVRWQARPRAVGPDDADRWRSDLRADMEARFAPNADARPMFERSMAMQTSADRPVADSFPAHEGMQVAENGDRIWLKEFRRPSDEGPDRWMVLESDGRLTCWVQLPELAQVTDAGPDWALVIERDELDVEYVVQYRVDPPSAPPPPASRPASP